VQRKWIELVRQEDFREADIAGAETYARTARAVNPEPARIHMRLPVGGNDLQIAYIRTQA
jgi:hypothetical protein